MSYAAPTQSQPVITLPEDDRIAFMGRVYQHLGLALAAFVAFEFLLFTSGMAERLYDFVAGSGAAWLLILGAFMVGGWLTTQATFDLSNPARQYGGLFGQAALYSIIFAPFLYYVFTVEGGGDVWTAAVITALGFAGLSATAWVTRRDLSFIRPLLIWGGVAALLVIVGAVLFGAQLGTWFSVAMIALMGASILYNTQQILHRYPAEAHVGAAVNLFGSLMTMFWYVLSLVSSR